MNPLRHLRLRTMLDAFVDDELDGEAAAQVSLHLPSCCCLLYTSDAADE